MYLSSTLASETLERVNRIWSAYSEFQQGITGIICSALAGGSSGLTEEEHRAHLLACTDSILEDVAGLSGLYPEEALQTTLDSVSDIVHGARRLLNDFKLGDVVWIPGRGGHDGLQSCEAELAGAIYNMASAIAKHLPLNPPLSEPAARILTPELLASGRQSVVQQIFILFEELLRARIGAGPDQFGEGLINAAFGDRGQLSYGDTPAERVGARNLLSGMYGLFRNPRMHRTVQDDEETFFAIVSLVDLAIRIVDGAQGAK